MSVLVLNEETEQLPIGDVIRSATAGVVEIQGQDGRLVARLELASPDPKIEEIVLGMIESEKDELRRRMNSDRSSDITTAELLARCRAAADQAQS